MLATNAAVTATVAVTSAVIGSIVDAPSSGCVPIDCGGVICQKGLMAGFGVQGSKVSRITPE